MLEEPVISMPKGHPSHKAIAQQTQAKKPTAHEDEKIALIIFLSVGFTIYGIFFNELVIMILDPKSYMTPDIVYVPMNLSL